ncbi:MutS-related protein [Pedobacter psychroterrae]|uniref:DNA mismatch repair protein MutS n=1 Tax=Pedobacter psychroterrae TaxID=2530453 RepID=A0A4R0NRD2_9SPHI|nr:DNA mismatch repair protein MutS [Pedobacter psychroterrae]TCD03690.1 DNA mismatch repair protein MutS [Pedobacter psychroterrae]
MVKTKYNVLTAYQNSADKQQSLIDDLKKKLNRISFSRLGLFILEILIVALIISLGFFWYFGVLAVVPVFFFLILIKRQARVQNELDYALQLLWVYQNEIDQLTTGKNGYADGDLYSDEQHPYTGDLDILGPRSVYANVNRCNTTAGLDLLASGLLAPAEKITIELRQEAIKELVAHIDETYHFRAELQNHKPSQLEIIKDKLVHQLPLQLGFARSRLLKTYVSAVPFLTVGLLVLGVLFGGVMWNVFALIAVFNAGLTFFNLSDINKVYYGFTGSSNQLNAFAGTIKWTEDVDWQSQYIKDMFKEEDSGKAASPVSTQIRQLTSIIQAFDARLNILVSLVLNLFLLWDLKCSVRLADWHSMSSVSLVHGLYRISQFEELISFATLTHNHPDWNFPVIEDTFQLHAVGLGHPLINEKERVLNNFELAVQPTVDIVTGSNMAGKSTFLRTLGVNMVLGFAGAPVCADSMSLSIFKVFSYMRIKDSLNDHTSTFKAELNRLKMILDAISNIPNSFVLIDEMLRGTNSKDKYLGSKVFIEKLISQNTPALFATHDLQLSEMEVDYPQNIRNYHFDIQMAEDEMRFDYKLKHGPCKTFNAALLLKQIGLSL